VFSCHSKREIVDFKVIKDDLGREVKVKKEVNRVMALSASLTEMLYLICADSQIIGRTPHCDEPSRVISKTVVNNYPIDFEKLLMLNPDLIFVKDGIISLEAAAKIEDMGIPVYFQHYENVEDIMKGLEKIGEVLNRKARAAFVADSLRSMLSKIEQSVDILSRPKVLMVISKDQIFVYGKDSYASDMLKLAGGVNAVDSIFNNPFPQVTSEYILHINPDIIIGAEQVDIKDSFFNLHPELKKTKAFLNRKVYKIGENLLSRPGPRVVQGVESLKKYIHPDAK
jgi:iron complex transport system substrate-binding protein